MPRPDPSSKKLFFIAACAVLLCVGGAAAFWLTRSKAVEVIHPIQGPAVLAVYATGTVEATVMLPLAPRITARLMELLVDEGSEVKKNQPLARFEDEDLRQAIKELQAKEKFARKEYERKAVLVKQKSISKSDYDRSRSEWESAKAAMAKAAAELDYTRLLAPADGRIIRRDGEVGELITANQPVFWLSCCAPLRITAEVDEEDIPLVRPGQKVLISADAFPSQIFQGEVQSITPKGDPVARSYRVRIGFGEDAPLLIGMTAETNIIIRETDSALLLPSSAVTQGEVWVVKDGKLAKHAVETGAKGPEQVEIISGIKEDDIVVVDPATDLKEGERIRTNLMKDR